MTIAEIPEIASQGSEVSLRPIGAYAPVGGQLPLKPGAWSVELATGSVPETRHVHMVGYRLEAIEN